MNDLKQGDGVIAVYSDGKKRFGTVDGRFGSRLGVTFQSQLMPKPKFEFINPENITPLYSLGDGFDVLFDSNPYQYPCKFSVYDWQLHVTHQRKPLCVPKNENMKPLSTTSR